MRIDPHAHQISHRSRAVSGHRRAQTASLDSLAPLAVLPDAQTKVRRAVGRGDCRTPRVEPVTNSGTENSKSAKH